MTPADTVAADDARVVRALVHDLAHVAQRHDIVALAMACDRMKASLASTEVTTNPPEAVELVHHARRVIERYVLVLESAVEYSETVQRVHRLFGRVN